MHRTRLIIGLLVASVSACGDDAAPITSATDTAQPVDIRVEPVGTLSDQEEAWADAPAPVVMRLTDQQYSHTLYDILGVTLTDAERDQLPRDYPIEAHYSTNADSQVFNSQYVIAYAEIARSVTERLDSASLRSTFGGCSDDSTGCLRAFAQGLGLRLFRRPVTDDEAVLYSTLADEILAFEGATADDAVIAITQAMLQAPAFLYRLEDETTGEPGTIRDVNGYEFASRLSYFLWQSAPDDQLLDFAAGPSGDGVVDWGALPTEIDRMMANV